ncbi:MAG: WYL domain-containing protein [Treponemataceae bacterium]|nr:WYL domain-containing protein [Treponemataceae bacterium]
MAKKGVGTGRESRLPAFRMTRIDEEIRSGSFPNANTLANMLEVSSRTIQRDIEYMRDFYHAPLEFDSARNGYFYSEPNFFIKTVTLTEGELFFVALFDQLLEQYRGTPIESNLRTVFKKIIASLPEEITVDSSFLENYTTFIPERSSAIDSDTFNAIFSALKNRTVLTYDYRPLQKTTYMSRRLNPYHAVCQKGNWYVIGWCHDKQDIRIFNFSRMKNAVNTAEHFAIPGDFRATDYFDPEIGVWLSTRNPCTVELLVSKEIGTFALEHAWKQNQTVTQNDDGSVTVRFETSQLPEVKRWVLGQGRTVTVISPPQLIDDIRQEAEAVAKKYT